MPLKILFALVCAAVLAGCSGQGDNVRAQRDKGQISVVTTFSTLNSFVVAVGGSRVRVQNLVPIGASPENFQPAPQDIATLSDAQLVFENGGSIDTWLQKMIRNAGASAQHVIVLSNGLPKIDENPHHWMDPVQARQYLAKVRDALIALDPADKDEYRRNAARYDTQLNNLQKWIAQRINTIPPQRRAMIIFHNAFDYYNRRFGIKTVGVIELSPGQDPNPAYIGHLVDLARANGVHAVFAEPEYSPKLADTLAKSAGIRVVTNLYDDSISSDPRVNNYLSMLRYDTNVIVESLK
jgi:ABC-type Zn uptake system ZnuABC Zn-binding protein ZnuA